MLKQFGTIVFGIVFLHCICSFLNIATVTKLSKAKLLVFRLIFFAKIEVKFDAHFQKTTFHKQLPAVVAITLNCLNTSVLLC